MDRFDCAEDSYPDVLTPGRFEAEADEFEADEDEAEREAAEERRAFRRSVEG